MRKSNRDVILKAAATILQDEGITAITLESVAAEAGLTKGGLMYHFPTREALLLGIHEHYARRWDHAIEAVAGRPAEDVSRKERLRAYLQVATQTATRAEFVLMLEATTKAEYLSPWREVMDRWVPPPSSSGGETTGEVITRLTAEGLWFYNAFMGESLEPAIQARVIDRLGRLIELD